MTEKHSRSKSTVKKTKSQNKNHKNTSKKTKKVTKSESKAHAKSTKVAESKAKTTEPEPLVEGVELKFNAQHALIKEEINTLTEKLKEFKNTMKKLESAYKQDIRKVSKAKRRRKTNSEPTGFIKTTPVPKKLAKFLGVKEGDELSGPEITRRVWKTLAEKGLQYEKDKRVFRTNKEVTNVFGVDKSVNKSTTYNDENGFNFCNIQRYIAHALKGK